MARNRQYARYQHFVTSESAYELERVRTRVGNAANFSEISRLLEENGSIDEVYRTMLLSLLTVSDGYDPHTDNIETREVTEPRRKSNALKKRKRNINIMEQEDDWDVEEQMDPDYEFILRQLKDLDRSFVPKFEKGVVSLSQAIKYEVLMGDDGDDVVQIDKWQFYQNPVESLLESVHPAQTGEKNKARDRRKLNKVARQGDREILYRDVVQLDKEQFDRRPSVGNGNLVLNQSEYRGQAPISEKNKVRCVRKEFQVSKQMNLIRKEKKPDRLSVIQIEREYLNQKSGPSKRGRECALVHVNKALPGATEKVRGQICLQRLDKGKKAVVQDGRLEDGLSSKKTAFGNAAVKKEPYHSVKTHRPTKGIDCQIRNAKRTRCSTPFKKSDGKCFKGESSRTVPAEVEILDNDMVVKKGMFGHFVSSKQFHCSMMDEEPEEYGLQMASEDFRTEVLKVLRKPYNKEEYHKCREQIRVGSYTDYHPDLQTKLTKFRYKREKCLIVLRGFLFWLQNLTRKGAFEPWKDKECLAVELPSC
ncbi:hypothetical protein C2S52_000497 [Perilla frutescens var. hirtella]|nr:hypothetical protein C2S52_000497 [Perilla frutescens var. hirtella]